jgi:hypothetical protein
MPLIKRRRPGKGRAISNTGTLWKLLFYFERQGVIKRSINENKKDPNPGLSAYD